MFTRCARCTARISIITAARYWGLCRNCAVKRNIEAAEENWGIR